MSADPPRRPPERHHNLFRSKSYQGPPRRKRQRQVLEDITWILNDEHGTWRPSASTPPPGTTVVSGRDENSATLLRVPAEASVRDEDGRRMRRGTTDATLPQTSSFTLRTRGSSPIRQNSIPHPLLTLPPRSSIPYTGSSLSSSPTSSPVRSSFSGQSNEGSTSVGTINSMLFSRTSSSRSSLAASSDASRPASPSLRGPPLRRSSSSSLLGMSANEGPSISMTSVPLRRHMSHTGFEAHTTRAPTVSPQFPSDSSAFRFEGPLPMLRVNTSRSEDEEEEEQRSEKRHKPSSRDHDDE